MVENYTHLARWRTHLFVAALMLLAGFSLIAFFKYDRPPGIRSAAARMNISATVLPEPVPVPAFALRDHHGNVFTHEDLRGKWTLMAFGYTSCPNVCPMLLTTFRRIDDLLTGAAVEDPPNYLFVTVDPNRDTVERLAGYVPRFGEKIVGLTGDAGQIRMLAGRLGIVNVRRENAGQLESVIPRPEVVHGNDAHHGGADAYLIDHTASILMLDPDGNWRSLTSPPYDADEIMRDYRKLVSLTGSVATVR